MGENAFLEHCHCNLFTLRRFEQIFFVKDLYIKLGGGGDSYVCGPVKFCSFMNGYRSIPI